MNDHVEDEKHVGQAYRSMSQFSQSVEPSAELDDLIKQSASKPIINDQRKKYNYRFISIAATVVLTLGVVLKLTIVGQDVSITQSSASDDKKPMYMLQRSRPVSETNMILQIETHLSDGEISKARQLHKKFRHYYPDYKIDTSLSEKLHQHNII